MKGKELREIWPRVLAAFVGVMVVGIAIWSLENDRAGLSITPLSVGTTPATVYRREAGGSAPAVIIAHGFAGSRQLMENYALTLAQAGYVAVSFDFAGHGRNPKPMSGDLTSINGTTQLLMREIGRVTDAALTLPGVDGRIALLGHSMASDIIVRQAIKDLRVAATVAISMFSQAVTDTQPQNLLIITGEWETFLRTDALRNVRLAEPSAEAGQTIGDPSKNTGRRAVVAPGVEHISVLYSTTAMREVRDWLDIVFDRKSSGPVYSTGGMIVLLLAGLAVLAWPIAGMLPRGDTVPSRIPLRIFLFAVLVPAVLTPVVLTFVDTHFLPVLVADYLAVHLGVFGLLCLGILLWGKVRFGHVAWFSGLALAMYGIVVFGGALNRYAASFVPDMTRLPIILAISMGAVPYMLADSLATEAGRSALWRVVTARVAFLASLGIAVAFDVERLFFLLLIIPVIMVFFTVFGLMGGWVGRQTLSPAASGIGLGLILAWALGVSFPMFVSG